MAHTQRRFTERREHMRRLREQVCKQIKAWHKNAEKARDKERLERLAALKDNDFDKSSPSRGVSSLPARHGTNGQRNSACPSGAAARLRASP